VVAVIILNNLSSDKPFGFGNPEPATSQQHDKLFMKAGWYQPGEGGGGS
jgi:hypothetical protein